MDELYSLNKLLDTLEGIVIDLANSNIHDSEYGWLCVFCDNNVEWDMKSLEKHTEDCVYRRAVEYTKALEELQ
jgi:hypothetical protein